MSAAPRGGARGRAARACVRHCLSLKRAAARSSRSTEGSISRSCASIPGTASSSAASLASHGTTSDDHASRRCRRRARSSWLSFPTLRARAWGRTCEPGEGAQRRRRARGSRASLSAGSDPRRRGPGTRPVRPLGRHAVELDVPLVPHSALSGRFAAGGSAPARDPRAASRWAPRAARATYPGRKVFLFRVLVEPAELQNKVVLGAAALIAQGLAAISTVFPEALVQTLLRKHTEVPVVASCAHAVTSRTLFGAKSLQHQD